MSAHHHRLVKIAVLFSLESKVNRDRFSGILRYASTKNNWEIRNYSMIEAAEVIRSAEVAQRAWLPDGIIVVGNQRTFANYQLSCNRILRKKLPRVVIDGQPRTSSSISDGEILTDDATIGRTAADYFIKKGFSNFAFVGTRDKSETWHARIRLSAYRDRLAESGFSCASILPLVPKTGKVLSILEIATRLNELESPCAVFAYSDEIARHVLDACRYANIPVPEKISVLGVDDQLEITENTRPPLSSILPDFESSGFQAAKMLDEILSGAKTNRRIQSSKIICINERSSTQDVRGGGRIVRIAIEYIRLHLSEAIRTRDIGKALNLSPRLIEMRFRETLNCSVLEKITALRIEKAIQLMSKTEMTLTQIAYACGYATPDGLKLAFRKSLGLTMSEWRQQNISTASKKREF